LVGFSAVSPTSLVEVVALTFLGAAFFVEAAFVAVFFGVAISMFLFLIT
jgi:hypothetical protein